MTEAPEAITALLGKSIRVTGPHGSWEGRLAAYAPDPSVIVDTPAGRVCLSAAFEIDVLPDGQPEAPAVTGLTRWHHKTTEVEAVQWTGENEDAIRALASDVFWTPRGRLAVCTSGGYRDIAPGDWVCREEGALFCCAEKTFAHNYEPAPEVAEVDAAPPAPCSPAASPRDPSAAIVDRAEGVSAQAHRPGPKRMLGREAVQHCYGCGARWPCEGSWQLRAEVAEAKLAETERQLEHAREAAAGSHEGIRLWMLDCSRIAGKHRERAERMETLLGTVRLQARVWTEGDDGSAASAVEAACGWTVLAVIGSEGEK